MYYNFDNITERDVRRHVKQDPNNKVCRLDIYIGGRRIQRSLKTTDKELGVSKVMDWIKSNQPLGKGKMRLSDLHEEFLKANPDLNRRYLLGIKLSFELFIQMVGNISIASVETRHVIRFRTEMLQRTKETKDNRKIPLSGHTINGYFRKLRSAFALAVKLGEIDKNPFTGFPKTQVLKKNPIAYDPKKYRVIYKKVSEIFGEDSAKILDVYLFTGMRLGEGPKLTWDDIDFESRLLYVPAVNTKKKTDRKMPLTRHLIKILKGFKENGYSKPIVWDASSLSHNFTHARDGWKRKNVAYEGTEIKGTFHSLRKTTVTYLKKIGLDKDFRDIMIGHAREGVSAENYTDYELAIDDTVRTSLEKMVQIFYPEEAGLLLSESLGEVATRN